MEKQNDFYPSRIAHVCNRGVNKQKIFFGESDRVRFVESRANPKK
ncbi:MAG: hypothetical protein WC757_02480 [Candidatus Paceibacterota bacterium]|jgi:hypothetical protein